ncbi:MAG: methionine synthase, partial [Alphaproteobacteria bacterium]|nr:methionine synthase [Alphaproteobacteria bacterium]
TLEAGIIPQAEGLIAGGVDACLIETCQDPLQIKAAINAVKKARQSLNKETPIFVQVTVETTGTLLVGSDIAAAATAIQAMDVDLIGLNCATGPQEMAEHVKWLSENWPHLISVQPNAGLPELVDGQTHYPLSPEELARWVERFVVEDGVNMIGGCCGTNTGHIKALDEMLRRNGNPRPAPVERNFHWVPSAASLYTQASLRQENAIFTIGERCNANGSKKFRDLQEAEDWDQCVAIGKDQAREGSTSLDVCTAFVGRNEVADMTEMVSQLRGAVTTPLVIDSTELPVIDAALKLYGGKAIINSINFEDGEQPATDRLALAKKFGAAVVALTIDEEGMAKDVEGKIKIAQRLHDFVVAGGLPASDLMIDPLTFTICTGNDDDRKLGIETLDAIERIAKELPEIQIILGLSNISFGLKAAARHVLNSVFLDHAVKRGMTGAIVHISKIKPLHTIAPEEVKAAEDLIFDRRREGYDPLHAFIALFQDRNVEEEKAKARPETVEERLKLRIIEGDRNGLEDELDEAREKYDPLTIINTLLLDGMKVVGELFGSGKMQLPFVLQSAETMKAAVKHLEQFMDKTEGSEKGTLVLATVKGDVHDIGKNLVDIILTNNGYKVINLGIKQPINTIIDAVNEHKPDAVGLSGLLVKSTVIMRENLEEMTRQGLEVPVFLGGAALTRKYVETDCSAAYAEDQVAYARDAFDGLNLMDKAIKGEMNTIEKKTSSSKKKGREVLDMMPVENALRPLDVEETRILRKELPQGIAVPKPPFWGAKIIEDVPLKTLVPFINENTLFQFQWGYKKAGRKLAEYNEWAAKEVRPIMHDLTERCEKENILKPQAAYGFWKCASEGNTVVLFEEDGTTEATRFSFPRQAKEGGLCIADFFRDVADQERDVIGLQVVTMGQHASEVARKWFENDKYQDYLYLHGYGVEMAEALAEYVHKRIRESLGMGGDDPREMAKILKQRYRGSRYSFGYPACPDMTQQHDLLRLLGADKIGLSMADEEQLHPEQSTAAIVVHHPAAKYFVI